MPTTYQFTFTNHLRERFKERFCKNEKFENISELDKAIFKKVRESKENKAVYNNTRFIIKVLDKYGSNDFKFYCIDDIIFVIKHEKNKNLVITCLNKNEHYVPHLSGKSQKYRKKNTYQMKIKRIRK